MSTQEQLKKLKEASAERTQGRPEEAPPSATPPPQQPAKFPPHAPLPLGAQPLLDAQLGEALKIMRDYSDWVHSPSVPMEECINVGDAIARLMSASATLAAVAVRFQNGEPETRQRLIVEYAGTRGGRGPAKLENE